MKNNYTNMSLYPTMTNSVLDDICNRSLEIEADRIAILANALKFDKRLDISRGSPIAKAGGYSLSTALLALILMNGEILANSEYDDVPTARDLMRHTLRSYLKRCLFTFNAPSFKLQQTFINKCRFRSPTITARGAETKGYLYRLLPGYKPGGRGSQPNPVRFNDTDRATLSKLSRSSPSANIPKGHKLDMLAQKGIEIVIEKLERIWPGSGLAEYLHHHLELDRDPPKPEHRVKSMSIALDMMAAIYQALLDDREIRLARFASDDDTTDPVAIFIAPEPDGWRTEYTSQNNYGSHVQVPMMFSSWDNPSSIYERERLASLEVAAFDERGGRIGRNTYNGKCFLRSYSWVNGVCDFRGQQMGTYVFPLPGIMEIPGGSQRAESNRKRKREADHDGVNVGIG